MKSILTLSFLFLFASALMFADIKNNYQQNRVDVSLQVCLYNNWGRNFDADKEYDHTDLSLYPSINYFIADNFSLGLFTGLSWTDYHSLSHSYTEDSLDLTIGLKGEYYLLPRSKRRTTLVPSLGTSLALTYAPTQNNITYTNLVLYPYVKLSYLVNRQIAMYVKGGINVNFLLYEKESGTEVEFDFGDEISFNAGFFIGFSYFIPNKKIDNPNRNL